MNKDKRKTRSWEQRDHNVQFQKLFSTWQNNHNPFEDNSNTHLSDITYCFPVATVNHTAFLLMTSFCCESQFMVGAVIKSKHGGETDGEQEMRVAVSNQIPGFERLCPAPLAHHTHAASMRLWLFKDETKISFFPNLYAFFSLLICICLTALVSAVACRFFSLSCFSLPCGTWDLVPRPGMEPGPPALEWVEGREQS